MRLYVFINKVLPQNGLKDPLVQLKGRNLNVLLARYVGFVSRLHHNMTVYRDRRDIHCDSEPLMNVRPKWKFCAA